MIKIISEPAKNRIAAYDDEKFIGECTYYKSGENWVADHTFVESSYAGQGIAAKLVEELVNLARHKDVRIEPVCSYVIKRFEQKKEYEDVLLK